MRRFIFYFLGFIVLTGTQWGADYTDDLILKGRSDSAIKFLTPPMSLIVIHNRPAKGRNYFFIGEEKRFNDSSVSDVLDPILSDPKTIKLTLVKTDPTRLVPAKQGADVLGPLTRSTLLTLAKEQFADLFLIFRWEVRVNTEGIKLSADEETSLLVEITLGGLIYISKQEKILALPTHTQVGTQLPVLTHIGLKKLSAEARKIIRAQKEITSDSY